MTLQQILLKLSYATIPLFWPVWLATAAAALYLGFSSNANWRSREPFKGLGVGTIAILAFLLPYLVFMLWGVAFAYHDNDLFIETAAGRSVPLSIWPYEGRYFPLFFQEFNALALIAPTAVFYHSFAAVQLVLFCGLLGAALSDLPIPWRVGAVALLLSSNSIGIIFADPIYPERNIVFWLAALIVALQRADRTPSRLNVMAALLAAHLALYYKEPVFLLIGTVAAARLVIAWRRVRPVGWSWLKTRPLELGLLVLCVVFASQLCISLLGFGASAYATRTSIGPLNAALRYVRTDPLLLVLLAGIALRAGRIRLRDMDPIWDSLALGAVVYLAALVMTGMFADRYVPPVDMIGVLFGARQAFESCRGTALRRWLVGAATVGVAGVTLFFGAFRLLEHKSVVRGTVELAEFVERYATTHSGQLRLYFPNTEGWRVMNFATYLQYRHPQAFARVRFLGPHDYRDGRCIWYRPYACERALAPEPGDIVLHLPDDAERADAPRTRPLFQYELLPGGVPAALGRLVYVQAPLYAGRDMPDGWLTASAALQE